ncbi:hypothetical protein SDC9_74640 [bioreactor metagenome]|uniref:Uncharacterized protein n=1 Tax=bioreactor metagenome TaxID=1076179 RepID=A0A644YJR0_9ZZZZ
MKRILRHPATNAVCISLFTGFYALIFLVTSGHAEFQSLLYYSRAGQTADPFWAGWSLFLSAGFQKYIAWVLIALTALVVAALLKRRRPFDEYHTAILTACLSAAVVLTLIAIAFFYLLILSDPNGIVEKFTLFITIHWITVVLADFTYVLLCR